MPGKKASLVLTTVFDPELLDNYCENFRSFGHIDDVEAIIIPDRKTPQAAFERCAGLRRKGLAVRCPDIDEQNAFLERAGLPPTMVPYNSDNRRNIGYLMAYQSGADFVISIDDDNYCLADEDFLAAHAVVSADASRQLVAESSTGYLNICGLLELEKPVPVYPRGFPYHKRHLVEDLHTEEKTVPVHINAGLWTIDPDIDAITWLVAKPRVTGFTGRSLVLGPRTWTPVNSQNTALRRDAVAAYYFVRMGYPLSGMPIDRYGDIFSGYFVQACARHLGGYVRAGTPVAEHRRNSHNYMKDATNEWACILVLEDLLEWLTEAKLDGRTYIDAYVCLSHLIQDAVETMQGPIWTDVTRGYFHRMGYQMRLWSEACRRIEGRRSR